MPEQKKIPILVLFSAWKPSEDLRPLLTDMLVTGAVIDRQQRCIQAEIQCAQCPDDARRARRERELAAAYGVQRVTLRLQTPAAEPQSASTFASSSQRRASAGLTSCGASTSRTPLGPSTTS